MASKSRLPAQITLPEWPIAHLLKFTSPTSTWLVGGTVRDLLINRPLHDWDFVTSDNGIQLAKKVANDFKGAFYILDQNRETGRAVVVPPSSAQPITLDFASLRALTLTGDLKNRDFTINAMAMSLSGHLIDPLHCQGDLADKTIRMTTSACFKQDPVRLLRAIRQSQELDFRIDGATYEAICKHSHLIGTISPERINAELCSMLSYPLTADSIMLLEATHILQHILPELMQIRRHHDKKHDGTMDPWLRTIQTLSAADYIMGIIQDKVLDKNPPTQTVNAEVWRELSALLTTYKIPLRNYFSVDINVDLDRSTLLRWAALLHRVQVEEIRLRLTELRMPNKSINYICKLIQAYPLFRQTASQLGRREIYHFYKQTVLAGPGVIILSLALAAAEPERLAAPQSVKSLIHRSHVLLQAFFEHAAEFITPIPFLRGDDLLELGILPGPKVGVILDRLLEAQVTGVVTSRSSAVDFVTKQLICDS